MGEGARRGDVDREESGDGVRISGLTARGILAGTVRTNILSITGSLVAIFGNESVVVTWYSISYKRL